MIKRNEKARRYLLIGLCEALVLVDTVRCGLLGQYDRMALALATALLVLVPEGIQRLFRCRISRGVYLTAVLYALGPMLGHCNNFYYLIPRWDKLLHTLGGVMFVFLGAFLFDLLGGDPEDRTVRCLFALLFSIAVAVLWEFFEFAMDFLIGMDMQSDTVIHTIRSHLLDPEMGAVGTVRDIREVTLGGAPLGLGGYLDIGLIDTMADMLLETLGAAVTATVLWLDKGRHPVFLRKEGAAC